MLALSWKMFVMVSRLGAIWLDVTWKGKKKSLRPAESANEQTHRFGAKRHVAIWLTKCLLCVLSARDGIHFLSS